MKHHNTTTQLWAVVNAAGEILRTKQTYNSNGKYMVFEKESTAKRFLTRYTQLATGEEAFVKQIYAAGAIK